MRLDERLDEQGGLIAQDVGAEQRAADRVGVQPAEATGVLQGPAVGRVVVRLGGLHVGPLARQILNARADRRDLRVSEHGGRHPLVPERAQVFRMGQVMTDRPGFGVGDVLELEWRACVADGPDPVGGRPAVLIDLDAPVVPELDPGELQAHVIGVRLAPGGHQQQVAGHLGAVLEDDGRAALSRRCTPVMLADRWTSQRCRARAVKRSETSVSSFSSRVSARLIR